MTHIEKLNEIAHDRGIDTSTLFGKINLLREILVYQDKEKANDFMVDTFTVMDDEIDHAFKELGLEEEEELSEEEERQLRREAIAEEKFQIERGN